MILCGKEHCKWGGVGTDIKREDILVPVFTKNYTNDGSYTIPMPSISNLIIIESIDGYFLYEGGTVNVPKESENGLYYFTITHDNSNIYIKTGANWGSCETHLTVHAIVET